MEKLDLYDRKLLAALDRDSTLSLSKLAKALRRSKPFVLYRMQRLEEAGIITGYHAIVDMSKLGNFTFRVYIKFQQMIEQQEKEFIAQAKKLPDVWTITSMHGKWDYALFLGVKNIAAFHQLWDALLRDYKQHIKLYNIAIYAPIYNFNRTFFVESKEEVLERVYGIGERVELDETDIALLHAYASNVRLSSLELSKHIPFSADTIRRRIKQLEQAKIIVGYKLGLNLQLLDLTSYRVDVHLLSTKRNKALFAYCKQHPYIYQINKTIGGADFELELVAKDLQHLLAMINEMKSQFADVVNDVEYFAFSTFHKLKFIPD